MRVAHVITRMIIGGAQENTLLNCLDLMHDFGDDVLLITGKEVGPEGDLLSQGRAGELPICKLDHLRRSIHPVHDIKGRAELRDAIRKFKPDVVHTHSAKGGILGRAVAWSEHVPAIIHSVHGAPFHQYQPTLTRTLYRTCERWAAKRCHHMVCVADAMTDLMVDAKVAPREMFTTIYSGMNVEPFLHASEHRDRVRKRFGLSDDAIVIGKIARLFHLKGHDDLISAAAQVVKQVPQVRFLLVGDGVLREPLNRRIESLGLSEHFVFSGLVPPDEVPSLIGAMDALVHTSYREGLARALPQALIAGRPVISYDVDGAREVAISGETGFLIPPGDIDQLAQSITKLSTDRDMRLQMGRAGQRRFTDQFRHQTMTRRIRELYERVLKGTPA
ncbi:2-deoxystreptamine glucosyltransferase [Novipirellula galeiformis]|uniref:2-deoxystreptamine glucosyltransferase n=1 Tax=Novipirellula galeiformis TaxID=2528004 RepID=A0A5C6CTP5_9BACT|nr:glycosyltransferase family 4 protein [Novipirellula galeiformis]TWU26416.1 2-deoxystreptamine glucosyltransferase [Novipirellula galeiformis]